MNEVKAALAGSIAVDFLNNLLQNARFCLYSTKERQVRGFEILKPDDKGLMNVRLGDQADSNTVEQSPNES